MSTQTIPTIDTTCCGCGRPMQAIPGTIYPQCDACAGAVDLERYEVAEQWEYRCAFVSIQKKQIPSGPRFRGVWQFDDGETGSADSWTTSQTLAGADARRAIDRKVDGTTDHYSLSDRLAEEEAGAAMADQDHDGLS